MGQWGVILPYVFKNFTMHLLAIPCFQQNIPLQYAVSKTKLAPVRIQTSPSFNRSNSTTVLASSQRRAGEAMDDNGSVPGAHIQMFGMCVHTDPQHGTGQGTGFGQTKAAFMLSICTQCSPNVQRNLNMLGYFNVHLRIYSQVFCGAVILTERIITRPKALRKLKHGVCDSLSALHLSRPILP